MRAFARSADTTSRCPGHSRRRSRPFMFLRSAIESLRLSVQIIDLQSHRTCAGAFDPVKDPHYVAVRKRAWGPDENSFLDPHLFGKVDSIAQLITVCVVLQPLLKYVDQHGAKLARVIYRTHI